MSLRERYLRARGKKMSADFDRPYDTREMTLREEIENLKECNVPEPVIERMLKKHDEIVAWNDDRREELHKEIDVLEEQARNRQFAIDAIGYYIASKIRK